MDTTKKTDILEAVLPVYDQRIKECRDIFDARSIEGIQMCVTAIDDNGKGIVRNFYFTKQTKSIPQEFRQFIHDYCTRLCGERLKIEAEL